MKKYWLCIVAVALMLSCTAPTSTVTAPTREVAFPTPPITDTGTPVIPTPTAFETLPTAQSGTDDRSFFAIIARMAPGPFFLLGGTENGEWLSAERALPQVTNNRYQLYNLKGPAGSLNGNEPIFDQICQLYRVDTDLVPLDDLSVGVSRNREVTPRPAQEFTIYNATYIEALREWLVGHNIPDPVVEISQILRVDLEGDGTDEVLISSSHFVDPTGHSVEVGDYSLVLMRRVVGDSVMTIPVIADYYYQNVGSQFPLTYAVALPVDLNNDGVLEILVGIERWEGSGVMVFEIDGTSVRPVFKALCGL